MTPLSRIGPAHPERTSAPPAGPRVLGPEVPARIIPLTKSRIGPGAHMQPDPGPWRRGPGVFPSLAPPLRGRADPFSIAPLTATRSKRGQRLGELDPYASETRVLALVVAALCLAIGTIGTAVIMGVVR